VIMMTSDEIQGLTVWMSERDVQSFQVTDAGFSVVFRTLAKPRSLGDNRSDGSEATQPKQSDVKKPPEQFEGFDVDMLLHSAG